ncbi:unnamed protein product [Didymodactylos carnosus]|uniref:Uncharacterized protein n=1 Tax=Didymodactylos carnosus TaxID=1234261 RepID=A0A813ZG01_9BILA|nr:unnamed protein product [Didymodactylos carnosus]CAF0897924.1 unnamed protein product [Didymodactylos carnosus]CAF3521763.1 unnamed protein product [Didymodactylos carnosus]CAF3680881.1 unnamed protein product [Didymodactylos carnosus]
MGIMRVGNADYSQYFLIACILMFISMLCCITAFAAPYWTARYQNTPKDFRHIGLWELCLYKYRHYKDDLQKPYTGCFWFWGNDMYRLRDWIIPPWFKWVQGFATLAFIFTIVLMSAIAIALFSTFRWRWKYMGFFSIIAFAICVFEIIALSLYGVRGQDRLWMPRPEFNFFSFGYWSEFAAAISAFFASTLFFMDARWLRAPYDAVEEKRSQNRKSPSNGSHLLLTNSFKASI